MNSRHLLTRRGFAAAVAAFYALAVHALAVPRGAHAQAAIPPGRSVSPDVERANVALVNAFCAAFARHDLDAIVSMLADNCTYRVTQDRPAVVGKEQVTATIKGFLQGIVDFKVLRTVVMGPTVINERDDIFRAASGDVRTFRIAAGVFFVDKGKIVEWTDYLLA